MNELLVFIWIASAITIAASEFKIFFKECIAMICPSAAEVNCGLLVSLIFSVWAIFSYQTGLLFNIGVPYNNLYFKYFDLTITSLITAGGAGIVYQWIEAVKSANKKDNSGPFSK